MIETLNEHREKITEDLKKYISTRIRIQKLIILEEGTKLLSKFYSSISLAVVLILVVLFLALGGAIVTGDYLEMESAGFFIFAGVLLVFGVVLYIILRKWGEKTILFELQNIILIEDSDSDDKEKEQD